jgi:hypothetical protein
MPFPSFFLSGDRTRLWSVTRAAVYGAGIGSLAALFKTFGPRHAAGSVPADFLEIAAAPLAFALLCAAAAALHNFIGRRLI